MVVSHTVQTTHQTSTIRAVSSMEGRVDTDALETWTQGGSGHSWEREEGKGATARVVPARRADSSRPLRSGVVPLDRFVPPGGEIPRLRERDAPKLLVFEGPGASVTLEVARCMARDRAVVADVLYAFEVHQSPLGCHFQLEYGEPSCTNSDRCERFVQRQRRRFAAAAPAPSFTAPALSAMAPAPALSFAAVGDVRARAGLRAVGRARPRQRRRCARRELASGERRKLSGSGSRAGVSPWHWHLRHGAIAMLVRVFSLMCARACSVLRGLERLDRLDEGAGRGGEDVTRSAQETRRSDLRPNSSRRYWATTRRRSQRTSETFSSDDRPYRRDSEAMAKFIVDCAAEVRQCGIQP